MLLLFPSLVLFTLYPIIYALSRSRDTASCKRANLITVVVVSYGGGQKYKVKEGQIKKGMPLTFSETFERVMK